MLGESKINAAVQMYLSLLGPGSPCVYSTMLLLPSDPASCRRMLLLQQCFGILFYPHHLICGLVLCTACTETTLQAGLLPSSKAFLLCLAL